MSTDLATQESGPAPARTAGLGFRRAYASWYPARRALYDAVAAPVAAADLGTAPGLRPYLYQQLGAWLATQPADGDVWATVDGHLLASGHPLGVTREERRAGFLAHLADCVDMLTRLHDGCRTHAAIDGDNRDGDLSGIVEHAVGWLPAGEIRPIVIDLDWFDAYEAALHDAP